MILMGKFRLTRACQGVNSSLFINNSWMQTTYGKVRSEMIMGTKLISLMKLQAISALIVMGLLTGPSWAFASDKLSGRQSTSKEVLEASAKSASALAAKYAPDLRSSLRLIVRAYEIGVVEKVAFQYYDLLQKDETNPKLMAEYAFAYLLSEEGDDLQNASAERRMLKEKLRKYPYYVGITAYRADSLKRLPSSPEVYIMAAAKHELHAEYKQALPLNQKAVSLDPDYGYAHYRVGQTFGGLVGKALSKMDGLTPADADKYAQLAINEFKTAQKLDSTITGRSIVSGYAHAYTQLKQYKEALFYLDQLIASANKKSVFYPSLLKWRQRLAAHQSANS